MRSHYTCQRTVYALLYEWLLLLVLTWHILKQTYNALVGQNFSWWSFSSTTLELSVLEVCDQPCLVSQHLFILSYLSLSLSLFLSLSLSLSLSQIEPYHCLGYWPHAYTLLMYSVWGYIIRLCIYGIEVSFSMSCFCLTLGTIPSVCVGFNPHDHQRATLSLTIALTLTLCSSMRIQTPLFLGTEGERTLFWSS